MKETKNIASEEIRKMIDDWYSGTTDSDRDAFLFAYFSETSPEEIPEDLKEEAEIFSLLALKGIQCSDDTLLNDIEKEIKLEKRENIRKRILKFSAWSSAAACVMALVIGLSQFKFDNKFESRIEEPAHLAESPAITKSVDTTTFVASTVATDKVAVNSIPAGNRRVSKSRIREVTDVNEAAAILVTIDNNLQHTLSAGIDVLNKVDAELVKTVEITNRVLNNISI